MKSSWMPIRARLERWKRWNVQLKEAVSTVFPMETQQKSKKSSPLPAGERLKNVLCAPLDEFPPQSDGRRLYYATQIFRRIASKSLNSILQPTPLVVLSTCSTIVLGVGCLEAWYLISPEYLALHSEPDNHAIAFILDYSLYNFSSSCIWDTTPADIVARAMYLNPDEVLRPLTKSPEDSQILLKLLVLRTQRSLVAGFMVISQILSIMNSSIRASSEYSENVLSGYEAPLDGVHERIVRLVGAASDVTEVSMSRYGSNVLPVLEDPKTIHHLIKKWSSHGKVPCIWRVRRGYYGYRHSWAGLKIDRRFMLRTSTGKSILCIEADLTKPDESFHMVDKKSPLDLTMEDASQGFRMIERAAAVRIERPFRMLRVVLGDSYQIEENQMHRIRCNTKKECDIFIDSKGPLLLELLKWCNRQSKKRIVFDTTKINEFQLYQRFLDFHGFHLITMEEATKMDEKNDFPFIIYYSTTAATVNAVRTLIDSGIAHPKSTCVLINNAFGLEHLKEISDYEEERIDAICAAEIYDDYLRQVRLWTRMGYSSATIQLELDLRFQQVLAHKKQIE